MSDRDDSDRLSKERDRSPCKKRRRDGGQLRTDPSRYKTKLCSAWMDRNTCAYKDSCQFAHGKADLRSPAFGDDKAKTKLCEQWATYGSCSYEHVCRFAHGEHELRSLPNQRVPHVKPKRTGPEVCRNWQRGACSRSPCKYAHGGEQNSPPHTDTESVPNALSPSLSFSDILTLSLPLVQTVPPPFLPLPAPASLHNIDAQTLLSLPPPHTLWLHGL